MATVVQSGSTDSGNGVSSLLSVVLFILIILAVVYFGLPLLRGVAQPTNTLSVPGKVDVNVNK